MVDISLQTLPPDVSPETVVGLLNETRERETVLGAMIRRFEQRYGVPLKELETRLDRGEGSEHPDWEDSIEWRNALEALERTRVMRNLLEWLLPSIRHSLAS